MTSVVFSYNPITVKSEVLIKGEEIARTSNLYRYRNTPLEDWIDVLIPELVDYCNDDDITIELCSVPKYIDDIQKQIREYCKKYRYVVIEPTENAAMGYKGRLNKLKQIEESIYGTIAPDKVTDDVDMEIIVASMNGTDDYFDFIKGITGSRNFNSSKGYIVTNRDYDGAEFEKVEIDSDVTEDRHLNIEGYIFPSLDECSNKYWRVLKEKINSDKDFLFVVLLEDRPKDNDELFDYLAEQLSKKGKISRSRFAFVSGNSEENCEYLRDEYGVQLNDFFDISEVEKLPDFIKSYIENIGYVKKIAKKSFDIKSKLESSQRLIARAAELSKGVEEIENCKAEFNKKAEQIRAHYLKLEFVVDDTFDVQKATERYLYLLMAEIRDAVLDDVLKKTSNYKADHIRPVGSIFAASTSIIRLSVGFLDTYSKGEKSAETKLLAEMKLCDYIHGWIKKHCRIRCRDLSDSGYDFSKSYPVEIHIGELINKKCKTFVEALSKIEKKTESGAKIDYFGWVTEHITRADLGLYSVSKTYLNVGCGDYNEVDKKILLRLRTIEPNILSFFEDIAQISNFDSFSEDFNQRLEKVNELIDEYKNRFDKKCDEIQQQMDIGEDDKRNIMNISELIDEINSVIEL